MPPETRLRYLTTTITNTGITPLRVPFAFFNWQLPGQKHSSFIVNPMDAYATDEWVAQRKYPVEILPKATEYLMISDIATFQKEFTDMIKTQSFLKRMLYRFIRVTILTDDGRRFKAKIGKGVRTEIEAIINTRADPH
jgi:hypothetical protein